MDDRLRREILNFLRTESVVDDRRLPSIDVRGFFADLQVRNLQLDAIAKEVDDNWQEVCAVYGGVYSYGPYFTVQLEPFSEEGQRRHWPLGDRIKKIVGAGFIYTFLPRYEQNEFSSEIVIYQRPDVTPSAH